MPFLRGFAGVAGLLLMGGGVLEAQETPAPKPAESSAQTALASPIAVTLKRAIELALLNSKEIQVAKIQASVADHAAQITKAQFMPNLYAGSGAGYTNGMPETPGGRAPPHASAGLPHPARPTLGRDPPASAVGLGRRSS